MKVRITCPFCKISEEINMTNYEELKNETIFCYCCETEFIFGENSYKFEENGNGA